MKLTSTDRIWSSIWPKKGNKAGRSRLPLIQYKMNVDEWAAVKWFNVRKVSYDGSDVSHSSSPRVSGWLKRRNQECMVDSDDCIDAKVND